MDLLNSFWNVIVALAVLVWTLILFLAPWTPLIAWVAFWLLAVNWRKLYPVLTSGGLIGVLLIAGLGVLVWSTIAAPADGYHHLYGLQVGNMTGKAVYVTSLLLIAFLCGSVQLTGCCNAWCSFDEPTADEEDSAHH